MLGRIAAAAARQSPFAGASRGFAAKVTSPVPLSIRKDSLFVQCTIAALVYFVPQDVVILGPLFWSWHSTASAINPKKKQPDAEAALEAFKAKKGLDKLDVSRGRSTWYVTVGGCRGAPPAECPAADA